VKPVIDTVTGEFLIVKVVKGLRAEAIGTVKCEHLTMRTQIVVKPETAVLFRGEPKLLTVTGVHVPCIFGDKDKKMNILDRHYIGELFVAQYRTNETNCELLSKCEINLSKAKYEEIEEIEFDDESEDELEDIDEVESEDDEEDVEGDDWKSLFKASEAILDEELDNDGKVIKDTSNTEIVIALEEKLNGRKVNKFTIITGVADTQVLMKESQKSLGCRGKKLSESSFELMGDFRLRLKELLVKKGHKESTIEIVETVKERLETVSNTDIDIDDL
jgi:translation initiation factor 1 (eIF-1/SUI1)